MTAGATTGAMAGGQGATGGSRKSYRRLLLKLSGEALMGKSGYGIDVSVVDRLARDVAEAVSGGCEIAVVVGGGNIFRGLPVPPRAWTGRPPTTWACSRP